MAYVGKLHRIVVTGVLVGAKIHYMHVLHAYIFQAKLTYENRVQYRGPVYCPSVALKYEGTKMMCVAR